MILPLLVVASGSLSNGHGGMCLEGFEAGDDSNLLWSDVEEPMRSTSMMHMLDSFSTRLLKGLNKSV